MGGHEHGEQLGWKGKWWWDGVLGLTGCPGWRWASKFLTLPLPQLLLSPPYGFYFLFLT